MLINHLSTENNDDGISIEGEHSSTLTQRNLVTLYENAETRQSTIKNTCRPSNQYVETIIYQESDDSDVSEIYSNEDLYDVILINKERLDLINGVPTLDKMVCNRFDSINLQPDHNVNSKENLFLKYPFLKEQFSSLNNFMNFDDTLVTPLLHFLFCDHLDGCSSLYMDNIIQYTKRTIDQLKRISNGDYLTEKAKEKWRTTGNNHDYGKDNKLAVVVRGSDPIREDYNSSLKDTWRNLVYSALDIGSLRKILGQTVIIKIPRQIYASLNVTGNDYDNDLVITCNKEKQGDADDSRIDIVLKVSPSYTENLKYNVDPILVVQSMCTTNKSLLPIEYSYYTSTMNVCINEENKMTITEINEDDADISMQNLENDVQLSSKFTFKSDSTDSTNTMSCGLCMSISENSSQFTINNHDLIGNCPSEKQIYGSGNVNTETQISCFTSPPDDLFCSLQKLNAQAVLLEESDEFPLNKKKSSPKVRIKSPYENKSHYIEEMKRRKLLEIRERRERRKKIHSENCKVTKYKHGKGAIMAQSTNSVTKLSISNKSFYSSIYGDNAKFLNKYHRKSTYNQASEGLSMTLENDQENDTPKLENKKHLSSDYYLDDPETEVMNLQIKNDNQNETDFSTTPPNSEMLRDITMNFDSLVKYASYNSSDTDLKPRNASCDSDRHELTSIEQLHTTTSESTTNINVNKNDISSSKKSLIKVECRKSIDKIYELMNKLSKVETSESYTGRPLSPIRTNRSHMSSKNIPLPETESGTSLKHQLNSSNPSIYSFEETNNNEISVPHYNLKRKVRGEANVIPKVIISSKSQKKLDYAEMRTNKKITINPPENITKNPLKAISHLINEFDNMQKIKHKAEMKDYKRTINKTSDGKSSPRNSFLKKASRLEDQIKDSNTNRTKVISPNNRQFQQKTSARGKVSNQQFSNTNKNNYREKNVNDLLDETLREARGEAVRGPQRPYSRLDSLAQPKRVNVNGQIEKSRHGRTSPQALEKSINYGQTNSKAKQKQIEQDQNNAPVSKAQHNITSPDKSARLRRMTSTTVDTGTVPANVAVPSSKPRNIPEVSHNLKKMAFLETNLKKRSLFLSPAAAVSNLLEKTSRSLPVATSKIPHLTKVSTIATSSTTLNIEPYESKLRVVINSLQNEPTRTLPIIKESKTSMNYNKPKNELIPQNDSTNDELVSTSSDYVFDILEDKDVLTAVSKILPKNSKGKEDMEDESNKSTADDSSIDIPPHNEVVDRIENLEKALYHQIAHGTFHKRLKIKNFTLTPKQSMNSIFLLQSGDANSLLLNSCKPAIHINSPRCIADQLHLPIFRSPAEQGFSRLPVEISTVGYVFPKLQPIEDNPDNGLNSMGIQTSISLNVIRNEEKCNVEKGVQTILFDGSTFCNNFDEINNEKINENKDMSANFLTGDSIRDDEAVIKSENVNNTTSLDILIELLDEIEKITKYQSSNALDKHITREQIFGPVIEQDKCKTVKEILYPVVLNKQGNIDLFNVNQPNLVDKDVNVNITKESVNRCTDTSSQYCLLESNGNLLKKIIEHVADETIKNCTDQGSQYYLPCGREIPDSLTGNFERNSSHSLVSLYDYRTFYCNKFERTSLPKHENFSKKREYDYENAETKNTQRDNDGISYYVGQKDSDAILKMKRDILVTVYSILVFTVFAALSFPEFLYRS